MKTLSSWGMRIAATAAVCFLGNAGIPSITPNDYQGHRSHLRAKITLADGTARTVTLQGVGCTASMCSRVAVRDMKARVWLDGLASVSKISQDGDAGPVKAFFKFKNGTERTESVVADNRVLYLEGRFGRSEKLDLASLSEIAFIQ